MGHEMRIMRSLAFNTRLNGVGAATLNITQKNNYMQNMHSIYEYEATGYTYLSHSRPNRKECAVNSKGG